MSQVNYATMSDQELKQYFLAHRDDQSAFHAYMDRRHARPNQIVIQPDDPEADEKFKQMVDQQLGQAPA
jgi:hypothetical protein